MKDTNSIPEIERHYKNEWLLFDVYERDESDRPVKGKLVYHSSSRDEIHGVAMKNRSIEGYVVFAGSPVEAGAIPIL